MNKLKRILKRVLKVVLILLLLIVAAVSGINIYVRHAVKKKIISSDEAMKLSDVDCIVVLGASVSGDTPSLMLRDRLDEAILLYNLGLAPKIIMSGDHGGVYYDEVTTMKNYAINHGVPSEDIFKDHSGYSTYDTMYRAKEIFGAKKILVVSQQYHLTRCLYIAEELGLEAYGVAAEDIRYRGQARRDVREVLAIVKDFGLSIAKPKAADMGDKISLSQSGDVTNEREDLRWED